MTPDQLDELMRRSLPAVEVPAERVDQLALAVLARIDERPAQAVPKWQHRRRPGLGWDPVPLFRFAFPMALGVVLGVLVSRHFDQLQPVAQLGSLLLSTSFFSVGS